MYGIALLLAAFGLPVAIILLLFGVNQRALKLEKAFGLREISPPEPVIDEIVARDGDLVMSRRHDVDETLIALDKASSYGKTL